MAKAPATKERAERLQVAALPWRRGPQGVEILLITSRETRRWVTPKGGRMTGKTDAEAAAQEVLKRRASRWCVVALYDLEVTAEHAEWQEQAERERVWLPRDTAAARVDEPDLQALIAAFEP